MDYYVQKTTKIAFSYSEEGKMSWENLSPTKKSNIDAYYWLELPIFKFKTRLLGQKGNC